MLLVIVKKIAKWMKVKNVPLMKVNHNFFKNKYFPSTIIEWNKLDANFRDSLSHSIFKKRILEFIRPSPDSIFNSCSSVGLNYLTILRFGLNHLDEHIFRPNFRDS